MIRVILSLTVLCIALSSCSKYEDGPVVSLLPRKDRISNKWKIHKATTTDGRDTSNAFKNHTLELTREGSVIRTITQNGIGQKTNGFWQLNNSATDLDIFYDDNTSSSNEILRLKEKELWYRDKHSLIRYELEPY